MRAAGRVALMLGTSLACGCATGAPAASREELHSAVGDLEQDEFSAARAALLEAVSPCVAGPEGRRALLLLAAAELDPANPDGSPDEAARAAAGLLGLADSSPDERVLARVLFRLASDRGGHVDSSQADGPESLAEACGPTAAAVEVPELPTVPRPSTADRIRALQRRSRAQADSLGALQAEIQRITKLLTDDVRAPRGAAHR